MTSLLKVTTRWSGFTGSPGYSNFYFRDFTSGEPTDVDADAAADRLDTFWVAVKGLFPAAVNVTVQSEVQVIEDTTGELKNVLSAGSRASIAGSAAANGYSAASGVVINWRTGGVRNGRRVRGRTFLVPCATVAYDLDGSLQNSTITTLNTAANALIAGTGTPDLHVWSRPSAPGAADGVSYVVTSQNTPDKVAVLRSRRD